MSVVDLIVDFLWLSTEGLGLDFSNMSRRRMIVAIILWSVSNLLFTAGGLLVLLQKAPVFEGTTLNLILGSVLLGVGLIQLVMVAINWRAAIIKGRK